jgi:excisionase family DNA binding protein
MITAMLGSADKDSSKLGSIPQRYAYSVPEVATLLGGVCERYVWKLISRGALRSFKSGRLRLIAQRDLDDYINALRDDEQRVRDATAASA